MVWGGSRFVSQMLHVLLKLFVLELTSIFRGFFSFLSLMLYRGVGFLHHQCDQIGLFIAFWASIKACCSNYYAQIAHIFGNFCKGLELFHFSSEIIFGQFI